MIKEIIQNICLKILKKTNYKQKNKIDDSKKYIPIDVKNINIINKKCNCLINKNVFFINVGDTIIKKYMKLSMLSLKRFNPSFKIEFLNYTIDDFLKIEQIKKIIDNKKIDPIKNINKLINDYSFYLVYKYGCMYSTLDNFFVSNLDCILNNISFISTFIKNDFIFSKCAFFGVQKDYKEKILNNLYPPVNLNLLEYNSMKISFYNGTLDYNMLYIKNNNMNNLFYNFEV